MLISTGVVGDEKINCHNVVKIGKKAMKEIIGNNFKDVKMKRASRVLFLPIVNSAVKIHNTIVPIDPVLLFQRIMIAKKDDDELTDYLEYELAPFPLALFDESGMRKTKEI
ncbi:hypothetical protein RN001_015151 [Aquatica leii]|uniref:Uncharacterized protein n=1 Tax=Aquatica leii TaxID=1421715 RepID=A0AAN7SBX4_9COLE|nr:hypothetical protein RN001_015151 [Aquatica leii]